MGKIGISATTSERQNESSLSFFSNAVGATSTTSNNEVDVTSEKSSAGADARSAFTLIELLVVIAIIGLLSSVVLASLSGARESARDARRQQDLRQIETALNLYYNETGRFPTEGGPDSANGQICADCSANINTILAEHMQVVPSDPVNEGTVASGASSEGYYYYYDGAHDCEPTDDNYGGAVAAVYAFMETRDSNVNEICPDGTGGEGGGERGDTYKIILGPAG